MIVSSWGVAEDLDRISYAGLFRLGEPDRRCGRVGFLQHATSSL